MDGGNDTEFIAPDIESVAFISAKFLNKRDSTILRHACSGIDAAECVAEKLTNALFEITRMQLLNISN
ncbi:hypothetical protein A4A58_11025 [Tardiphaga robiniae]|uniref:Uncharacterized protein n=1 Tax=Tardiphaga robiniae TaxID=943830 RepID=A0A163Y176_9BRAD|nr:hypothetical protein A4A58_11025 [Tardiphaga robiniae]